MLSWFLRLQPRPHVVYRVRPGRILFFFPAGVPGTEPYIAHHIHFVYIFHTPSVFQHGVVCAVNVIRQRQSLFVTGAVGFIGNSDRASVVAVCTAISATGMSTISRSAG